MLRKVITKEARVSQIAQGSRQSELDASIQMAIKNLQNQIQALHEYVNEALAENSGKYDIEGNPDIAGQDSPALARLYNGSGAGRSQGDVVVGHPSEANAFTVTTQASDPGVVGVVYRESPDGTPPSIPDGGEGVICTAGPAYALVDADAASVSPGDPLVTFTEAGCAAKAQDASDPAIFATALESLAEGRSGIRVLVHADALVHAPAISELQDFDHSLFQRAGYFVPSYDSDGSATGFSGYLASAAAWTTSAMSEYIGHYTFGYNTSGYLASSVHSAYGAGGGGSCTVKRAFEYQAGRLEKIISELS